MNRVLQLIVVVCLVTPLGVYSQNSGAKSALWERGQEVQTFPLWENGAPGALGHEDLDIPTLTYYPALEDCRRRLLWRRAEVIRAWP